MPPATAPLEGVPLGWSEVPGDLPRRFASREALARSLAQWWPGAPGGLPPSPIRGGRAAAEQRLAAIDPLRYGFSRNHLEGAVTRLSPYLRHGVLSLAEVREATFRWLERHGYGAPQRRAEGRRVAGKFLQELGWRDYWQRLWGQLGDGIWHDREPLSTGLPPGAYGTAKPPDLAEGRTGLACIDAFVGELVGTGWLHNHARLWLASYLVHWRRLHWSVGARWFLVHLLDGDPASNNLSWQWVASSFSSKPYVFNRANLERFGGGGHCRGCRAAAEGRCPFDATYEQLQERLFAPQAAPVWAAAASLPAAESPAVESPAAECPAERAGSVPDAAALQAPVLWIHGEALSPANPALRAHPGRPALFVFDAVLLAGETATAPSAPSLGRRGFLLECLLELPVSIRCGDPVEELLAFAARQGADGVVTTAAVDPRFAQLRRRLERHLPVRVLAGESFLPPDLAPFTPRELGRFSRYWRRAEPAVWRCWSPGGDPSADPPPGAGAPAPAPRSDR
jgi:deoxyribodipyrimidine photo-lyase